VAACPECFEHGGAQGHHVASGCTGKAARQLFKRLQRDTGTEAVRDDRRFPVSIEQAQRPRHSDHFPAARGHVAIFAHRAVAHCGQVVGYDVVIVRKEWRDEGKAAGVGEEAVSHQHGWLTALPPPEIVDPRAINLNEAFLARNGKGIDKPAGQFFRVRCPFRIDIAKTVRYVTRQGIFRSECSRNETEAAIAICGNVGTDLGVG